jgi:hypothetical protein
MWFFSKDRTVLKGPSLLSLKTLLSNHLGTLLWASIIIPSMRSVRTVTGWIASKTKD